MTDFMDFQKKKRGGGGGSFEIQASTFNSEKRSLERRSDLKSAGRFYWPLLPRAINTTIKSIIVHKSLTRVQTVFRIIGHTVREEQ